MKLVLLLVAAVILIAIIGIAVEESNETKGTSTKSVAQQLLLAMPDNPAAPGVTATFGDPIVVSAQGPGGWEQRLPHDMHLEPQRMAAIDYNGDGLQQEVLLQIGGNTTRPGVINFGPEAEMFVIVVFASDGTRLHFYQCAHMLQSIASWSSSLKVPNCTPAEASDYYRQLLES